MRKFFRRGKKNEQSEEKVEAGPPPPKSESFDNIEAAAPPVPAQTAPPPLPENLADEGSRQKSSDSDSSTDSEAEEAPAPKEEATEEPAERPAPKVPPRVPEKKKKGSKPRRDKGKRRKKKKKSRNPNEETQYETQYESHVEATEVERPSPESKSRKKKFVPKYDMFGRKLDFSQLETADSPKFVKMKVPQQALAEREHKRQVKRNGDRRRGGSDINTIAMEQEMDRVGDSPSGDEVKLAKVKEMIGRLDTALRREDLSHDKLEQIGALRKKLKRKKRKLERKVSENY